MIRKFCVGRSLMRRALVAAAFALALTAPAGAAVKKVPYPEVKTEMPPPVPADGAFDAARKALAEAAAKKDLAALSALVAANFIATLGGEPAEQYDKAKDGLHNFKVAFGFRAFGKDADGDTDGGPQWELIADFAAEKNFARGRDANSACGPALPVPDAKAFERATALIEEPDQPAEWIYSIAELTLTASPDGGAVVGKAAAAALPVVGTSPPIRPGGPPPVHLELLLPSGKSGWTPVGAVKPLVADQLCFARQANGEWRISAYDQGE
jgi:hypothetical protein